GVGGVVGGAVAGGGGGGASGSRGGTTFSVIDGPISGAKVYLDVAGTGVYDAQQDTLVGTTNANGSVTITVSNPHNYAFLAVGGTDNGVPNTVTLKAPASTGGTVMVSPITTLVQDYLVAHPTLTPTTAAAAVQTALGIASGVDVLTYNPFLATNASDPNALTVQKVVNTLSAVTTQAGSANDALMTAIAANISTTPTSGSTLTALADADQLKTIVSNSGLSSTDKSALTGAAAAMSAAASSAQTAGGGVGDVVISVAQYAAMTTKPAAGHYSLVDTAANLTAASGLALAAGSTAVCITDAASLAQLTAVRGAAPVSATLTYAGVSDTAANLALDAATNSGAGTYVTGHAVTVTDHSVAATDLTRIDAATTVAVDATAVTTLTGALADVKTAINAGSAAIHLSGSEAVTVTGALTAANVADLNTVAGGTTGVVTATISGTAANMAGLTDTGNAYTVTVTDTAVAATDLTRIDTATTVAVNATAVTTLTGALADVKAAINAGSAAIHLSGSEAVTVSGALTAANVADLNSVAGGTTGVVTATISGTAAGMAGLTDAGNAYTVTVTDHSVAATDLTRIDAATTVAVNATAVSTLTGTLVEVKTAINAGSTAIHLSGSEAVTVSGALTAADVADLNTVAGGTTGVVTATISGAAADMAGLTDTGNAYTVTVTNAASIAQLTAMHAVTSGTVTCTAISDSEADLWNGTTVNALVVDGTNVTVTGIATIAGLTAITAANAVAGGVANGTLTVTDGIDDTAAHFAATDGTLATGVAAVLAETSTIQVTDAVDLAQLTAIHTAAPNATLTAHTLTDTGANLVNQYGNYSPIVQGIATLDASDNLVVLTAAQADTLLSAGVHFAANDAITVTGSGADLAALITKDHIAHLGGTTILLDAAEDAVTLTAANANALLAAGIPFDSSAVLTLSDTGAAMATVDLAHLNLLHQGWTTINLHLGSDATLTAAQASGIYNGNGVLDPSGGHITVRDTFDNVMACYTGDPVFGDDPVILTTPVTLSVAAIASDMTTGSVTYTDIVDTAADLLLVGGLYITGAYNVTVTAAMSATADQLKSIEADTTGTVTLSDTAAHLTAGVATLQLLTKTNVSITDAATVAQAEAVEQAIGPGTLTLAGGLSDTVAHLFTTGTTLATDVATVLALHPNVTVLDGASATPGQLTAIHTATGASLTLVDTAAHFAALSSTTLANLLALHPDVVVLNGAAVAATVLAGMHADTTGTLTLSDTAGDFMAANGTTLATGVATLLAFNPNVILTDTADWAQIQAVHGGTASTVTLAGIRDTAADFASAITVLGAAPFNALLVAAHPMDMTVTDALSVTEDQLNTIVANCVGLVPALVLEDSVQNFFVAGARLTDAAVHVLQEGSGSNETVMIDGSVTLAQAASVMMYADGSHGTLTFADGLRDTAEHLAASLPGTLIPGNVVADAILLLNKTNAPVSIADAATVAQAEKVAAVVQDMVLTGGLTDTVGHFFTTGTTWADGVADLLKGSPQVTLLDGTSATAAQVVAMQAQGGSLTLSDTAGNFANDTTLAALLASHPNVTVRDGASAGTGLLTAIDADTTGVVTLSDTTGHLLAGGTLVANVASLLALHPNVMVEDAATWAQAQAVAQGTTGHVTLAAGLTDTAVDLATALPTSAFTTFLSVSHPDMTATDALSASNSQMDALANVPTLSFADTVAHFFATGTTLTAGAQHLLGENRPVILTDVATVAQAVLLEQNTHGTLTLAGGLVDTAGDFFTPGTDTLATGVANVLALDSNVTVTHAMSLTAGQLTALITCAGAAPTFTFADTVENFFTPGTATLTSAAAQLLWDGQNAIIDDAATVAQAEAVYHGLYAGGILTLAGGLSDSVANFFVSGTTATLTADAQALLNSNPHVDVTLLDGAAITDAQKAAIHAATSGTLTLGNGTSGVVADGHIAGAKIYIDTNHNGVADPNEYTGVITDAHGAFVLKSPAQGAILAVGGTDLGTHTPNTVVMKAPVSATGKVVVNPITTLIQDVLEKQVGSGQSATADQIATAATTVQNALGLGLSAASVNLMTYDPLADGSTAVSLAVQKVAASLGSAATLVDNAGSAPLGGAFMQAIANTISSGTFSTTPLDLTNTTQLTTISTAVFNLTGASLSTTMMTHVASTATSVASATATTDIAGLQVTAAQTIQNYRPTITSGTSGSVNENISTKTVVYTAVGTDPDVGDTITWSLSGPDAGAFSISNAPGHAGEVTFKVAPDYEIKSSYAFNVVASDGYEGHDVTQGVTLAINDLPDSPTLSIAAAASTHPVAHQYNLIDTAANLAKAANATVVNNALNVTATSDATVAEATLLHNATNSGTATYSISDTAAALAAVAGMAVLDEALNITVSGAASLAEAAFIHQATNIGTTTCAISDTAAHFASREGFLAMGVAPLLVYNPPVTITDPVDVAQAVAVAAGTTGTVTLSGGLLDTVEHLFSNNTAISVTLGGTDPSPTPPGLAMGVAALLAANPSVVISDAATVAQAEVLAQNTQGTLTFSAGLSDTVAHYMAADGLALLTALHPNVTVLDGVSATTDQLTAIHGALAGGSGVLTVSDTVEHFFAGGSLVDSAALSALHPNVTLLDGALATADQLAAIHNASSGVLTVSDSVAHFFAGTGGALVDSAALSAWHPNVILSDAATVAQAEGVENVAQGALMLAGGLSDTVNHFFTTGTTLANGVAALLALNTPVTLNDAATVAQAEMVEQHTQGPLTLAGGLSDDLDHFLSAFATADAYDIWNGTLHLDNASQLLLTSTHYAAFEHVSAEGAKLDSNQSIRIDGAGDAGSIAIPDHDLGGNGTLYLGGTHNGQYTVDLHNNAFHDIYLDGTGNHAVTASTHAIMANTIDLSGTTTTSAAPVTETFHITNSQDGGSSIRNLQVGDVIELDNGSGTAAYRFSEAGAEGSVTGFAASSDHSLVLHFTNGAAANQSLTLALAAGATSLVHNVDGTYTVHA
ncbi:MAG: hypothetical protein HQL87_12650, partial [Magnetococcales bacterium]|nr:hypothetical protein [Magnetococcales bacterium]